MTSARSSAPARSIPRAGRGRPGRRAAAAVVGAVLAGTALAGCGSGATASGAASTRSVDPSLGRVTTGPDGVQVVTIQTEDDYVFTPDHVTVAPGKVRLTVRNAAKQLTHNLRFTPGKGPEAISAEIPILAPGQQKTIDFTVQTPGAYQFECSFHTQLGQLGTMTVSG